VARERLFLIPLLILNSLPLSAQPLKSELSPNGSVASKPLKLEFSTSEPLGLLRFLNGISKQSDEGTAYYDFLVQHHKLGKTDKALIWRYVRMRKYKADSEFEISSGRKLNLNQRLMATACGTKTFDEFFKEAKVYCDPADYQTLMVVMNHFRPIYEQLIWRPFSPQTMRDLAWFRQNEQSFARPLEPIARLFQSSAGREHPLKAVLVPAPTEVKKEGNGFHFISSAFSENLDVAIAQSMEVVPPDTIAAFNDPRVNNNRTLEDNDTIIHEFTHTLWAFRDPAFKKALLECFEKNNRQFNYDLLNESQASAAAAWFYKQVKGKDKSGRWYDNKYVDKYAKSLLPILESFATRSKDSETGALNASEYAQQAMDAFDKTFPDWREDPQIILWRSQVVQSPLSTDTLATELNDELFLFGGGDHRVNLVKGETWPLKYKNCLKNPGMTTVFLLDPGQIDILQKHFALSAQIAQELTSLVRQNKDSSVPVLKAFNTGTQWLVFSISSRQPLQKQGLLKYARKE
jgi:hypothetical protein